MEKGSPGVSNKIRPLAYDELSQVLQEVQGCRAKTAIFCDSSKNYEKLEKSQFLLRLIKSSGTGGRRVSSKNCNFCIFCNFSKNCEKLEKLLFLLKLIKSSVTGDRRVSSKNCDFCNFYDFSKNCKKMGEIAVFAKIN